jgi:hypothetical protein
MGQAGGRWRARGAKKVEGRKVGAAGQPQSGARTRTLAILGLNDVQKSKWKRRKK